MGIYCPSIKAEAETLPRITAPQINKMGILKQKNAVETPIFLGSMEVKISFFSEELNKYIVLRGNWIRPADRELFGFEQKIKLTDTIWPKRVWLLCPMEKEGEVCHRQVGVLYFRNGKFGCRHCLNLTYTSCKRGKSWPYKLEKWRSRKIEMESLIFPSVKRTYADKPTKHGRRLEKLINIHMKDDKDNLAKYYRMENRNRKKKKENKSKEKKEAIFGYLA